MSDLYLTDAQYLAALKRNRERIADGQPFEAADSDTIGNKYTEAEWGLCSASRELWPDDTNLFPDIPDRFDPKYRRNHHRCPMDKRDKPGRNGCFYSCRIFKGESVNGNKRDLAIKLYDEQIARVEGGA